MSTTTTTTPPASGTTTSGTSSGQQTANAFGTMLGTLGSAQPTTGSDGTVGARRGGQDIGAIAGAGLAVGFGLPPQAGMIVGGILGGAIAPPRPGVTPTQDDINVATALINKISNSPVILSQYRADIAKVMADPAVYARRVNALKARFSQDPYAGRIWRHIFSMAAVEGWAGPRPTPFFNSAYTEIWGGSALEFYNISRQPPVDPNQTIYGTPAPQPGGAGVTSQQLNLLLLLMGVVVLVIIVVAFLRKK